MAREWRKPDLIYAVIGVLTAAVGAWFLLPMIDEPPEPRLPHGSVLIFTDQPGISLEAYLDTEVSENHAGAYLGIRFQVTGDQPAAIRWLVMLSGDMQPQGSVSNISHTLSMAQEERQTLFRSGADHGSSACVRPSGTRQSICGESLPSDWAHGPWTVLSGVHTDDERVMETPDGVTRLVNVTLRWSTRQPLETRSGVGTAGAIPAVGTLSAEYAPWSWQAAEAIRQGSVYGLTQPRPHGRQQFYATEVFEPEGSGTAWASPRELDITVFVSHTKELSDYVHAAMPPPEPTTDKQVFRWEAASFFPGAAWEGTSGEKQQRNELYLFIGGLVLGVAASAFLLAVEKFVEFRVLRVPA
jgi:hypothetical protein